MEWNYNDGGREAAGFKGKADDCVVRAIAIATGIDYKQVYNDLQSGMDNRRQTKKVKREKSKSVRDGVARTVYQKYLAALGWMWVPTMRIGSGCKVHLKANELPRGTIITRLSHHLSTVVNGVIQDTFNPNVFTDDDGYEEEIDRCVYGYFIKL
jgi:hypothetical protein